MTTFRIADPSTPAAITAEAAYPVLLAPSKSSSRTYSIN